MMQLVIAAHVQVFFCTRSQENATRVLLMIVLIKNANRLISLIRSSASGPEYETVRSREFPLRPCARGKADYRIKGA